MSDTESTYRSTERLGHAAGHSAGDRTHANSHAWSQRLYDVGQASSHQAHKASQVAQNLAQNFAQNIATQFARGFVNPAPPVRVALITQLDAGLRVVREQLFDPTRYMVREVLSLGEARDQLADYKFDVLVLRIPYFSATHVQMTAKVRQAFPAAGIVASCIEVDSMSRFQARNIPMMKILTESQEIADLHKIIAKLQRHEASGLRQHIRNRREGDAEIIDARGLRLSARFTDFAQMGARMTVRCKALLQRGDRVQLNYRSSVNAERVHRIEAQVVWQVVGGKMVDAIVSGPLQTVGLRFIGML